MKVLFRQLRANSFEENHGKFQLMILGKLLPLKSPKYCLAIISVIVFESDHVKVLLTTIYMYIYLYIYIYIYVSSKNILRINVIVRVVDCTVLDVQENMYLRNKAN